MTPQSFQRLISLSFFLALTCCGTSEPASQARVQDIQELRTGAFDVPFDQGGTLPSSLGDIDAVGESQLDAASGDSGTSAYKSDAHLDTSSSIPEDLGAAGPDTTLDIHGSEDIALETDNGTFIDIGEDVAEQETNPSEENLWLLSIDNGTDFLQRIDIKTGKATNLCKLPTTANNGDLIETYSYPSLTFSRTNILFASRSGNFLDAINPCPNEDGTCDVLPIGSYGGASGVNGITSDYGAGLFGVAIVQDNTIAIDTKSGAAEVVGALGFNFGPTGATWSEADSLLYAIDATTDGLYTISPQTGEATFIKSLTKDFGTVGIELHPANGKIYACSSDAHLLEVDPLTGTVTEIGDMEQSTSCTNLAAPWSKVECIQPE